MMKKGKIGQLLLAVCVVGYPCMSYADETVQRKSVGAEIENQVFAQMPLSEELRLDGDSVQIEAIYADGFAVAASFVGETAAGDTIRYREHFRTTLGDSAWIRIKEGKWVSLQENGEIYGLLKKVHEELGNPKRRKRYLAQMDKLTDRQWKTEEEARKQNPSGEKKDRFLSFAGKTTAPDKEKLVRYAMPDCEKSWLHPYEDVVKVKGQVLIGKAMEAVPEESSVIAIVSVVPEQRDVTREEENNRSTERED